MNLSPGKPVAFMPPIDRRDQDAFFFGTTSPHWHDAMRKIFARLDTADISSCILHGYGGYDGVESGDIDCIVDGKDLPWRFGRALSRAADEEGFRLINWYYRAQQAHVFVLARQRDAAYDFFWLDVAFAAYEGPWRYYTAREMLAQKRRVNGFWATSPAIEFAAYLATKVTKHKLDAAHGTRLAALCNEPPDDCRRELRRFFKEKSIESILEAARENDWSDIRARFDSLEAELLRAGRDRALREPLVAAGYLAAEAIRHIKRTTYRTGLHLQISGRGDAPRELAQATARLLSPAFRRVEIEDASTEHGGRVERLRARIRKRWLLSRTALMISVASQGSVGMTEAGGLDLVFDCEQDDPEAAGDGHSLDEKVKRTTTAALDLMEARTRVRLGA